MKNTYSNISVFGTRLRLLRKEKGWSMDQMIEKLNEVASSTISKSSVSRWESGAREPMLTTVQLLSSFYGVSPAWLMGQTDDRNGTEPKIDDTDNYGKALMKIYNSLSDRNKAKLVAFAWDLWEAEDQKGTTK